MLQSWDWKELAACKDAQTIFFPQRVTDQTLAAARAICAECPVRKECRQFAQDNHEEYGIWAGKDYSRNERRRIKAANERYRQRNQQPRE